MIVSQFEIFPSFFRSLKFFSIRNEAQFYYVVNTQINEVTNNKIILNLIRYIDPFKSMMHRWTITESAWRPAHQTKQLKYLMSLAAHLHKQLNWSGKADQQCIQRVFRD
jgi:hypothetical protein